MVVAPCLPHRGAGPVQAGTDRTDRCRRQGAQRGQDHRAQQGVRAAGVRRAWLNRQDAPRCPGPSSSILILVVVVTVTVVAGPCVGTGRRGRRCHPGRCRSGRGGADPCVDGRCQRRRSPAMLVLPHGSRAVGGRPRHGRAEDRGRQAGSTRHHAATAGLRAGLRAAGQGEQRHRDAGQQGGHGNGPDDRVPLRPGEGPGPPPGSVPGRCPAAGARCIRRGHAAAHPRAHEFLPRGSYARPATYQGEGRDSWERR